MRIQLLAILSKHRLSVYIKKQLTLYPKSLLFHKQEYDDGQYII